MVKILPPQHISGRRRGRDLAWDGVERFGREQEASPDPQSQRKLASSQVLGEVLQSWMIIVVCV